MTVNYGDGSGEQVEVLSKSILVDPCGSGLDSRRLTGLVDSPLSAAWKILDKCSKWAHTLIAIEVIKIFTTFHQHSPP